MINQKFLSFLTWMLVLVICLIGYGYSKTLKPTYEQSNEILVKGIVLEVKQSTDSLIEEQKPYIKGQQSVKVKITEGQYKDRIFDTVKLKTGYTAYDFDVFTGDKLILNLDIVNEEIEAVNIAQFDRQSTINYLFYLFIIALIVVGGWRGFKSIISLGLTGVAVVKILIPAILAGKSPVFTAIIISAGVTAATFLLVSGFNFKSLAAILGTVMGTIMASVIAGITITQARLTELATEEGAMLLGLSQANVIDFKGLLLAGIIVGALGAIMDVGITVSSTVCELKTISPELGMWQLMKSGLNVGRDIIGTMANTLILAYAGGSLSLILIIMGNQIPFVKIVNLELFTNEIVRALTGSIGLFFAIPCTALISGFLFSFKAGDRSPKGTN
jgi:Predicted multitransmembrane protein